MIEPATVASTRALGYRTVVAFCDPCEHVAVVSLDLFPDELPIPDIALKVRCSVCGSKRIMVHLNVSESSPKGRP